MSQRNYQNKNLGTDVGRFVSHLKRKTTCESLRKWLISISSGTQAVSVAARLVYDDHYFKSGKKSFRFIRKKTENQNIRKAPGRLIKSMGWEVAPSDLKHTSLCILGNLCTGRICAKMEAAAEFI